MVFDSTGAEAVIRNPQGTALTVNRYTAAAPPSGWPSSANTGFLGDVNSLTPTFGRPITAPGTIIENERIDCSDNELGIKAANVTIRNCVIDCGVWGVFLYNSSDVGQSTNNLIVEDCTFIGGYQAGVGLSQASNWRVSRNNFHSGRDAVKPGGSGIVEDNYMHDPDVGEDAHNDCLQFSSCDGVVVQHNRLAGADTSCIAMFEGQGTFQNVTIDNNYMTGAGYILYAGGTSGTNIVVTDNVFGSWVFGPVTDYLVQPGSVWSGNTNTSGAAINP
jgi:hypothetical protein